MGVVREAAECRMKPSIPKEKGQRSLRSMEETQKMGYQTERKKKVRKTER